MKPLSPISCSPDEHWMRLALQEARQAYDEGEVPIGAVVVCGGEIVARGHNLVERLQDPTAHAEMLALTAACQALGSRVLSQCSLYVTIEPCTMCAGAIRWARLREVIYGAGEDKCGYQLYAPSILSRGCIVRGGVLEGEARGLMSSFFASRR